MHSYIIITYCTMNNFIKIHKIRDLISEGFVKDDFITNNENETFETSTLQNHMEVNVTPNPLQQITCVRNEIAIQLWEDYQHV